MFYFRRARKFAMWQVALILLTIVTTGQYLAAWGSYFEKKLSLNEYIQSSMRKTRRTKKAQKEVKVEEVQAQLEQQYLTKPSIFNTAPFQLMRLGKYMVVQFPFDIVSIVGQIKEAKRQEQERLLQEKLLEEERNIPPEPKKPRKRKVFELPEREAGDDDGADSIKSEDQGESEAKPQRETFVSGGLWTDDDITQLIKLCTKYPGGFPNRWETISMIMRRPVTEVTHFAKKVMDDLSKKQTEKEEEETVVPVKVKVKTKGSSVDAELLQKVQNWSKEEQKRLEVALQMYPKSTAGDRWAKIAGQVGKSKEECMQRYKHVADLVRKKKEQVEEPIDDSSESPPTNVEPEETPKDSITPTTVEEHDKPSGDSSRVSRQSSSSSSNETGSDNEWCILDSQKN